MTAGRPGRESVWTPEQAEPALALGASGQSIPAIADGVGLWRLTTRRILQRAGHIARLRPDTQEQYADQLHQLLPLLASGMPLVQAAAKVVG